MAVTTKAALRRPRLDIELAAERRVRRDPAPRRVRARARRGLHVATAKLEGDDGRTATMVRSCIIRCLITTARTPRFPPPAAPRNDTIQPPHSYAPRRRPPSAATVATPADRPPRSEVGRTRRPSAPSRPPPRAPTTQSPPAPAHTHKVRRGGPRDLAINPTSEGASRPTKRASERPSERGRLTTDQASERATKRATKKPTDLHAELRLGLADVVAQPQLDPPRTHHHHRRRRRARRALSRDEKKRDRQTRSDHHETRDQHRTR